MGQHVVAELLYSPAPTRDTQGGTQFRRSQQRRNRVGDLFGIGRINHDPAGHAIEHGLAGYSKNMDAATRNTRVTDNPLTVKAASASGSAKADLVLTKEDALKLRTAAQSQSFLAQARVMIVLD